MHKLLLELLTQAGPKHLASAPFLLSRRKNTKRLLTSPEQRGGEKEQAGRRASGSGAESEWERKKKKKTEKGQGAKGLWCSFHKMQLMKDREKSHEQLYNNQPQNKKTKGPLSKKKSVLMC